MEVLEAIERREETQTWPRFSRWVREGMRHQARGQLAQAAECYGKAHGDDPQDADALLLLGVAARQSQDFDAAIAATEEALRMRPAQAHFHMNLGLAFFGAGRHDDAECSYRDALALDPEFAPAWCCLGDLEKARARDGEAQACYRMALEANPCLWKAYLASAHLSIRQELFAEALETLNRAVKLVPGEADLHLAAAVAAAGLGSCDEAILHCKRAISLRPGFAEAYVALGNALSAGKDILGAALSYERAVCLKPGAVDALCNLAVTLLKLGRVDEAVRCGEQAVAADDRRAGSQHVLGAALLARKDYDGAEIHFREAVRLNPASPEHWNSLGGVLVYRRPPEEAEACYRRAIELRPDFAAAHVNLGTALKFLGRLPEMLAEYELGLSLDPGSAGAQYNMSLANLRMGRYREGWKGHEWRWEFAELRMPRRGFFQPQWRGEELNGRTILLHAEQGLGDTIQFIRYAPLVAGRGGRVIVEVQKPLRRLLHCVAGVDGVFVRGDSVPHFDLHCPLMSLPHVFETEVSTIPASASYLSVPVEAVEEARQRFAGDGFRVGIVWAGNPKFRSDTARSMPLRALLPLTQIDGVTVFSLQKGFGAEQLTETAGSVDAGSTFEDFYDTAAMMATLDVVITVDTSTAHLAGALGLPVWVLLPHLADWRWLEDREDCPWYESARLFRQRVAGDWDEVLARVSEALDHETKSLQMNGWPASDVQ